MPRSPGVESRRAALKILEQVGDGRTFDRALDRELGSLADPDRRLAHEMAAGVLRQQTALDSRIAPLVARGWSSVASDLRNILRLGAYQLSDLDRVPAHAAVDTSVALARESGGARAASFVNAILRRLARAELSTSPPMHDEAERLAAAYSHPAWLVRRWLESFGPEGTEGLLRWNNTRPRLVLQPARRDLDTLAREWQAAGIQVELAPWGAGLITGGSRPAELPGFREGHFIVQDPAQALLARFIDLPAGTTVYDACAAPGGKTIGLGRQAGLVVAGEMNRSRAIRLAGNLLRAGSGREHAVVADGRRPPIRAVEVALLDAPCLGTGTFARHPDARWRVSPQALAYLVRLQSELLEGAAAAVSPGGLLVYSTCSLEFEENRAQVDHFLQRHSEFQRESPEGFPSTLLSQEADLMILPQALGVDGVFAARLRRRR